MNLENVIGTNYEDIVPGIYLCRWRQDDWILLSFSDGFCWQNTKKNIGNEPVEAYGPIE